MKERHSCTPLPQGQQSLLSQGSMKGKDNKNLSIRARKMLTKNWHETLLHEAFTKFICIFNYFEYYGQLYGCCAGTRWVSPQDNYIFIARHKNPCYILKSLSVVTPSASAWPIFAKPNLPRVLAVIIKCSTSSLLIYLGWSSCLSWLDPAFERSHNSGFLGYIREILVEGWPGQWGSLTKSLSLADIEEKSECHTFVYSKRAA